MTERPKPSKTETLWAALQKTPERKATAGSIVRDMFGVTKRGTPNTKAAAAQLGVSQRTVQRWVKEGMPAKSAAAGTLTQRHASWRNSPDGRRARLSNRRESRLRNKGTTIVFYGKVRISADERQRGTTVALDGQQMGAILDQALAGNDRQALAELENAFGDSFGGSVALVTIEQLDTWG